MWSHYLEKEILMAQAQARDVVVEKGAVLDGKIVRAVMFRFVVFECGKTLRVDPEDVLEHGMNRLVLREGARFN